MFHFTVNTSCVIWSWVSKGKSTSASDVKITSCYVPINATQLMWVVVTLRPSSNYQLNPFLNPCHSGLLIQLIVKCLDCELALPLWCNRSLAHTSALRNGSMSRRSHWLDVTRCHPTLTSLTYIGKGPGKWCMWSWSVPPFVVTCDCLSVCVLLWRTGW